MKFTEIFAKLLKEQNINQTELAKELHISKQAITNLKTGLNYPSLDLLCSIAKYFNVSTDYLLGLKDEYGFDLNSDDTYSFEYSHGKTKLIHYEQKKPTNK